MACCWWHLLMPASHPGDQLGTSQLASQPASWVLVLCAAVDCSARWRATLGMGARDASAVATWWIACGLGRLPPNPVDCRPACCCLCLRL